MSCSSQLEALNEYVTRCRGAVMRMNEVVRNAEETEKTAKEELGKVS